jgi:NADPH-dependent curcumin reductase CurA
MTAYASLKNIAKPKAGEVAFVSGAAGAVGLVAVQLLKHVYGCKVIGSAGTDDKVRGCCWCEGYQVSRV